MIIGISTEPDMRQGMELIAENMELRRQLNEMEMQMARLRRLNVLLNAEVEHARRERERQAQAEKEARDAELWAIVDKHTAILHAERRAREEARGRACDGCTQLRPGNRRRWQ